MTTLYTGDPDNVSSTLAWTVTSASNATPIVLGGAVHGFSDGDYVSVSGVGGNTAANGTWRITYISLTSFSLDGSVGNGAYTAGGAATDMSLTPMLTEPQDGEARTVASVELMTRLLADRTQFLAMRGPVRYDTFDATGTWVCPPGVTVITVEGCGGGGGGGGSGPADTDATESGTGGGGGGGSRKATRVVTVTPGASYAVAIGAGGTSGPTGTKGGDGGTTSFNAIALSVGGAGGNGSGTAPSSGARAVRGGPSSPVTATYYSSPTTVQVTDGSNVILTGHGDAGPGTNAVLAATSPAGNASIEGFAGGAGGARGATVNGFYGGGGGGGGGGGPYGVGAAGKQGGDAGDILFGIAANGWGGLSAAANTGGGGGGAGAGGQGTVPGAAATGGVGGSGKVIVIYSGMQAKTT